MKKRIGGFILLGMLFLAGCGAEVTENNLSQLHFVKAYDEIGEKTQEERAFAIKQRLGQIEEVTGSAVVVEGHTAIIGLRLSDGLEQKQMQHVKKEADTAARAADEYLENTSITMNRRIVALIEEMERARAK